MSDQEPRVEGTQTDPGTETVLEVRDLHKTFKTGLGIDLKQGLGIRRKVVSAVQGVSFEVQSGEVFGFLGPNGAGKTTTIKMCMGLIRATRGTVSLFGDDEPSLDARARIGYLPEHPYFYDYLTPVEILDFYGRLFGIPNKERRKRIDALLERVGLEDARRRALRKFSKGMLQRVGIAQALINDPDLLVLDEPLSGLDPIGRKEIRDILVELRSRGKTIFFSSHILSDIETICDRVAIIHHGKVQDVGRVEDLVDPEEKYTEITFRGGDEQAISTGISSEWEMDRIGDYRRLKLQGGVQKALRVLVQANAQIESVQQKGESLEELFVRGVVKAKNKEEQVAQGGAQ